MKIRCKKKKESKKNEKKKEYGKSWIYIVIILF